MRSLIRSIVPAFGFVALLVIGGCSGASAPAAAPQPEPVAFPDVSGSWRGFVSVEGQGIDGTLTLTQTDGDLEAVFRAPAFGLRATGTGFVTREGEVEVVLDYNLQCPGEAVMQGRFSSPDNRIEGDLDASDCTGAMLGSFRFSR